MANTIWPNMKMLGLLITVFCSPVFCSAQIDDNFSDGNLSVNPIWIGDIDHFNINSSFQLQLKAEGAGISSLVTSHQFQQNCEWQFWIKLAFSPSGNNNCRIYLMTDKADLSDENINGYFLQFGESGSKDAIELFRQNGNEITSICRTSDALISGSFEFRVKLIRSESGLWELYVDQNGGCLFTLEASGSDQEIQSSEFFGLFCKYTSSNNQKFYFDDVYVGTPIIDDIAPQLTSLEIIQANQLKLEFSESLNPESTQILENFSVNLGVGNPILVQTDESLQILDLYFLSSFEENKNYQLSLQNIQDFSENTMGVTNFEFIYFVVQKNDLVINEILFDPLEDCEEYVEIYNRSDKILNFKHINFARIKCNFPNPPDTTLCRISDTSIFIHPKDYWIISPSPENVRKCYFTEFPTHLIKVPKLPDLINREGFLFLVSDSGILIDKIHYREDMHHPSLNFTDGVALEKIHFETSGLSENSWQSATKNSDFGTPTFKNSQFYDSGVSAEKIIISPEVFSPNQDGEEDLLSISLNLKEEGGSVNIFIFNSEGQQIRYLVKNELTGMGALYFWNGLDEENRQLAAGIYIIYVEVFNLNGNSYHFKKTTVLAKKFK